MVRFPLSPSPPFPRPPSFQAALWHHRRHFEPRRRVRALRGVRSADLRGSPANAQTAGGWLSALAESHQIESLEQYSRKPQLDLFRSFEVTQEGQVVISWRRSILVFLLRSTWLPACPTLVKPCGMHTHNGPGMHRDRFTADR